MAKTEPLADYVRRHSPISMTAAANLLGRSDRSVTRMIEAGQLAEPARFGKAPNSPLMFDLADVLLALCRRVLDDEDLADVDDDPGLFDRTEATG